MYIPKTGTYGGQSETTRRKLEQNVLGKDDFLRLLTTQLKYQDPMNPVQDQDFIAQLAQFSALEQTQNLALTMERFAQGQEQMALIGQATALLGREVEAVNLDTGERITGKVSTVQFVDGVPRLVIGEEGFYLWEIQSVRA